jgi:hypothetical protein
VWLSRRGLAALRLLALVVPLVSPAHATGTSAGTPAGKPPSKISFIEAPSAEKPAARKKRLQKECRGRPDAGACRGLTGRP